MNAPEKRIFSTFRYKEIQYLVIPKCGCTYIKNFLWKIDFQSDYADPTRVHDEDRVFARASDNSYTAKTIRENPYSFTVLRNPVDRFLSLYFDKVIGEGYRRFVPLKKVLVDHYEVDPDADSIEGHRRNCLNMLDFIELSLEGKAEIKADSHWTPQGYRIGIIKELDLKILMLQGIENKLKMMLAPLGHEVTKLVDGLERNASRKPVMRADLVDKALYDRIASIYHHDIWLTRRCWEFWNRQQPKRSEEVPRISDILD